LWPDQGITLDVPKLIQAKRLSLPIRIVGVITKRTRNRPLLREREALRVVVDGRGGALEVRVDGIASRHKARESPRVCAAKPQDVPGNDGRERYAGLCGDDRSKLPSTKPQRSDHPKIFR